MSLRDGLKTDSVTMTELTQFSRNDTNIAKGLAIMAMVFHHICPNDCALSVLYWRTVDLQTILASSGKVCVALLTILSGYGLTESYRKFTDHSAFGSIRFSVSHYFQLLSMYWCLYALSFAIQSLMGQTLSRAYGPGLRGCALFLLDFFGLAMLGDGPELMGGWFLTAIVVMYFLFPLIHLIVTRLGWFAIGAFYSPWLWYVYKGDLSMHTDWCPFYLVSFAIGILLSHKGVLDRMMRLQGARWKFAAIGAFVIAVALRMLITLPFDPVLALACLALSILVLSKTAVLNSFLGRLGALSAGIWLLHGLVRRLIESLTFETYYGRFAVVLVITAGLVVLVNEFKEYSKYDNCVRKVRKFIEYLS